MRYLPMILLLSCATQRGQVRTVSHVNGDPSVEAAVGLWNDQLGCQVFEYVDGGSDITFDPVGSVGATALATARTVGQDKWVVSTNDAGTMFDRVFVAVHELGHTLGLTHSRYGAMKPRYNTRDMFDDTPRREWIRIDDISLELARKWWCR